MEWGGLALGDVTWKGYSAKGDIGWQGRQESQKIRILGWRHLWMVPYRKDSQESLQEFKNILQEVSYKILHEVFQELS